MAIVQAELDTLNTAIAAVDTAMDTVIAGWETGDDLTFTPGTAFESLTVGPQTFKNENDGSTFIGSDEARALGNTNQAVQNIYALLSLGVWSSTVAA